MIITFNDGTQPAIADLSGALQKMNEVTNIKRHTATCPGLWETIYFLVKKRGLMWSMLIFLAKE